MKSALVCLATLATLACGTAFAQQAPEQPVEAGQHGSDETPPEDLPEIDWSRVNIDAYDLTRSAPSRDTRRTIPVNAPVWSRTENKDGSANMTVKRSLPTVVDAKVGVDMVVAPSPSSITLPGAQQQTSTGAAWASAALPSFGPWGWDQGSLNARLDPTSEQGKLGTTISKSVPLNEQMSLTVQSGFGVSQTLSSPALGMPSHVVDVDRSAKLSWAPTGTSFLAGSRTSSTEERWLNSFGAEQSLFGGISVRGVISETDTGAQDRSLTAGFKRTW